MILELVLSLCMYQEPNSIVTTNTGSPAVSSKEVVDKTVLTVQENKITWTEYCKAVEKEAQGKLGADFVVAYRPTQKPKFPVKLGGRFDLEKQVFIIDVLVDDPAEQKK